MTEIRDTGTALGARERRARNIATMRTWFSLQEKKDLEGWFALWADEPEQAVPFAPASLPRVISGKETLTGLYRSLFEGFAEIRIRDLRISALDDPDRVLVQWHTVAPLRNGNVYENELIGVFEFNDDGKVQKLTEYLDPTRVNFGD